jgi:hypothetical protein
MAVARFRRIGLMPERLEARRAEGCEHMPASAPSGTGAVMADGCEFYSDLRDSGTG